MFSDAIKSLKKFFKTGDDDMGGERETVVPSSTKKPIALGHKKIGDIRIHERKGKVHFHDDKNSRKVAIPVDRWFAIWEKLRTDLGKRRFYDTETNCMLEVQVDMDSEPYDKATAVGVHLSINHMSQSPSFSDIDKFTNG